MDAKQLDQIFGATFSPDQNLRNQMEEKLRTCETSTSFLPSVLSFIADPASNESSKLAASIYFKNALRKRWREKASLSSNTLPISQEDRQFINSQILAVMVSCSRQIRIQLQACVGTMIANNFPDSWPEFGPMLLSLLNSNDVNSQGVGLLCLLELAQMYRFRSSKNRAPFHEAVASLFPLVIKIIDPFVLSQDNDSQFLVKTVAKTFYSSIQVDLPPSLTNPEFIAPWFSFFIRIISHTVPLGDLDQSDIDELQKEPLFKSKKWACRSLNRLFNRYGCISLLGSSIKTYGMFAKFFTQNLAPKILEVYIQLVGQYTSKSIVLTSVMIYLILSFFDDCVKDKALWPLLKPHTDAIISHLIFPLLCYNESDIELWDSSPAEYVNKKIDSLDDYNSPILSASNLLVDLLTDRRKSTLMPTLQFINTILETYNATPPENRDERSKEGALNMMGNIVAPVSSRRSPISGHLDKFLFDHVFPEFNSTNKFLRARALDTFAHYSEVEFADFNLVSNVFEKVVSLLADPELPVRVYAALAIRPFILNESISKLMVPKLPVVVEHLLMITNQVDTDLITDIIESLADSFTVELEPYAIELAQQLCKSFSRIVAESLVASNAVNEMGSGEASLDYDQVNSKIMAALGILRTLGTLIINLDSNLTVVAGIEQIVYPIIRFVLDNHIIDLYEEALEIIDCCSYTLKAITPHSLELFNSIYSVFMDDGIDFVEEMFPSLENYVTFGFELLCSQPEYKSKIYKIIELVLTSDRVGENGKVSGCRLIEAIVLNAVKYNSSNQNIMADIDDLVISFLKLVSSQLVDPANQPSTVPLWIYLLSTVLDCFQYNTQLTLKTLAELGSFAVMLDQLVTKQHLFKRVSDKKVYVLGMTNLIHTATTNVQLGSQEHQILVNGLPVLFQSTIKNIGGYSQALKNKEEAEKLYMDIELDNPLSDVNPYKYFSNMLSSMQTSNHTAFDQLVATISPEEHQILNVVATEANKQ
ncbi:hypothetical protein BB560_002069 [Smittium megazygosporum]|uniref:Importin N-terminal domain-containing protein n=1 Tax=Smittium megazygosporum TaxID=133381 RepID=A0A2T9ZFW3_9FUNG|nr:hypothetical protein BB560_002069 [Smittium megazygosporum]